MSEISRKLKLDRQVYIGPDLNIFCSFAETSRPANLSKESIDSPFNLNFPFCTLRSLRGLERIKLAGVAPAVGSRPSAATSQIGKINQFEIHHFTLPYRLNQPWDFKPKSCVEFSYCT